MLIEGAFLKLPELLLSEDEPGHRYQTAVTSHLAMSSLHRGSVVPARAARQPNVAAIAVDLLRLCLLLPEGGSDTDPDKGHHENGRYLALLFTRDPRSYVALERWDASTRTWLEALLAPGIQKLTVDLSEEADSIVRHFGAKKGDLVADLGVQNLSFEPSKDEADFFYGFLVRIVDFTIRSSGLTLTYEDLARRGWTKMNAAAHRSLACRFLDRLDLAEAAHPE